ncbi:MAG: Hpt domain-containing protein [Rhizobiaceae bacterium]|nr:Hpt domain-containing protein [Rhizobiaceae bacterium]
MDTMTEIRRTFFEECAEQLVELDRGLAAFEGGTADTETIGIVYRAVHSIKGGAGAFELKDLVRFALTFEGVLNEIRADRLAPSPEVLALLRRAETVLAEMVAVCRDRDGVFRELRSFIPGAADEPFELAAASAPEAETATAAEDLGFTPVSVDFGSMFDGGEKRFHIVFKPRPELYANANESARLIREMLALGTGEVACDTGAIPPLDTLEPEGAYLAWTIELATEKGEGDIREIFDFAEFDCDLEITALEVEFPEETPAFETDDPEMAALFARLQAAS